MNKIIYTLGFLLVFSFFNNEAKAQTSSDIVACPKNGSGEVVITTILDRNDEVCDGEGATNVTLNVYSLGFCTSAPNVKFISEAAKISDDRDASDTDYTYGTSDFTSCTWTIKESSSFVESLNSVGDVEPLPSDEIPPPGTYTHAVIVISNTLEITGTATFHQDINDGTELGTGKKCWTNGTYFYDTGKQGPLQGTVPTAIGLIKDGGRGADCGTTPSPLANIIVYKYSNFEGAEGTACEEGCNTTRSEEESSFGDLKVLFTVANLPSLATNNPIIQRPLIAEGSKGINTATNTMTLIFAYNTPMVVTDKTTGMEIFLNFSNALSLDFEPTVGKDQNTSSTSVPIIRAIQSGPFGIQFKSVEGGGTD